MVTWYEGNADVHTLTAKILFGENLTIDTKLRDLAKRARYAYHYGGQPKTIWQALRVEFPRLSLSETTTFVKKLDKLHPGIRKYLDETLLNAHKNGFVECRISGRRHHFYGNVEPSKVFNLPIQMAAAAVINPAVLELMGLLTITESVLMQIHDSLTVEGPNPRRLASLLRATMQRTVEVGGVKVTFPIDVKLGTNWGQLDKEKDFWSKYDINKFEDWIRT